MGKSTRAITRGLKKINEEEEEKHSDELASLKAPTTTKKGKESSSITLDRNNQLELMSMQSVLQPKFGETQGSGSTMQPEFGRVKRKGPEEKIDEDPKVVEMCLEITKILMETQSDKGLKHLGFKLDETKSEALRQFLKKHEIAKPDFKKQLKFKFIKGYIKGFVIAKMKQQELDKLVSNEINEFNKEQSDARSKELKIKMAKFLLEKQQENDILNYVIEEEAYKS